MRRQLVAGNWKMHGGLASNRRLLQAIVDRVGGCSGVDVAVCVPFPYFAQAQSMLAGTTLFWGAQNVSEHLNGAYTGEVSVAMLQDFDCRHVIVGHSERRAIFAETDALVAEKFTVALAGGLCPILCVGETLAQREAGLTLEVIRAQLDAVLQRSGMDVFSRAVVAYEPVWAIGSGLTASPEQAQEVHAAIRAQIAGADARAAEDVRILYGGSVKPQNAVELFRMPDIDGGLIGGASLVVEDFLAICHAANR